MAAAAAAGSPAPDADNHDRVKDVARLKSLQNSGAFQELFWVLLTKTEQFCAILKKLGDFWELFWGLFDKYVEILCYFWELFNVLIAFGSFWGIFFYQF